MDGATSGRAAWWIAPRGPLFPRDPENNRTAEQQHNSTTEQKHTAATAFTHTEKKANGVCAPFFA